MAGGFLDTIFDPVLGALLNLHPAISIAIITLGITLITTIVYKYTTDQKRMKELKDQMKEYQVKIKALSKEDPQKAMSLQKKMMEPNLEYMKHSFKSTLYTMLPLLLIFAWLAGNIAYFPIAPGVEFSYTAYFEDGHASTATLSAIPDLEIMGNNTQNITKTEKGNVAEWRVKGIEGSYNLNLDYNNEKYSQKLLVTSGHDYESPEVVFKNSKLKKTMIGNEKVYPFGFTGLHLNWLWSYIIMSIVFSIVIRKIMKVY